jgi:hypothetical protein
MKNYLRISLVATFGLVAMTQSSLGSELPSPQRIASMTTETPSRKVKLNLKVSVPQRSCSRQAPARQLSLATTCPGSSHPVDAASGT